MKNIFFFFISLLCLASCEDNLDIFTENRGGPIIYGLLNLKDTVHYIKTYETVENSREQKLYELDTSKYEVVVKEYTGDKVSDSSVLNAKIVKADPNSVAEYETIYLYNKVLKKDTKYELLIKNKISGSITSCSTSVFGERDINYAVYNQKRTLDYTTFHDFEDLGTSFSPFSFQSNSMKRIYYIDITAEGSNLKYIEFKKMPLKYLIGDNITYGNIHKSYFLYMADEIPIIEGIERRIVGIDLYYIIPDEELMVYMNQYSNDLIQETEIDLDIENGYGIFACKYYWSNLAMYFDYDALDSLAYSKATGHLGFVDIPWSTTN